MKRTISVRLGGRTLILETDAYADLDYYLREQADSIESGLDRDEIMRDIEQRISDYFWEWRGAAGMVIRLEDVQRVRNIMGPIGNQSNSTRRPYEPSRREYRRLYRDGQDKVIGGVCSGLAYYFNMSPVVMRLIFGLSLLFVFAGFWVYIILWIAPPLARTRAQRLDMKGIPVTKENLEREAY